MLAQMIRSTEAVKREISIQSLLEWAFRVEHAQLDLGDAASMVGMSPAHVGMEYVMIERARLGCHIDGGGHSDPHPDADVVASALAVLPAGHGGRAMAIAIAEYARAGRMPDAMAGVKTRCVPASWHTNRHGKHARTELVETIEYGHRGRRVKREVRCCPVIFTPTQSQIAAARRFYLNWWGALLDLAATFRVYGGLSGHIVTNSMPPMTPWQKKFDKF